MHFKGDSPCKMFTPHNLKADYCIECNKFIASHTEESVPNKEMVRAALEFDKKGLSKPSVVLPSQAGEGALLLEGYQCVMKLLPTVSHIVNTAQGLEMFGPKYITKRDQAEKDGITFMNMNWQDQPYQSIVGDFGAAIRFIEAARRRGGEVLVHCAQGKSRSGSLAVAYCMVRQSSSLSEALAFVKSKRAMVEPNEGFMETSAELDELRKALQT
jgi:protein-tyrosine phosphatase